MNILLVEDDFDLAATLVDYMELEGIQCDHAANGVSGVEFAHKNRYQVIVLDLNLPKMDGLKVCGTLRNLGVDTPILMLTARDTLWDKIKGFNSGADDYLVKPFALAELVARVKVLARRRSGQVNCLQVSDLKLDLNLKQATRGGEVLMLSPTGLKILEVLMMQSPHPVSRLDLIDKIWGEDPPDSNSLKVHMFKLRKAVDSGYDEKLIHTQKNVGFAVFSSAEGRIAE